MRNPIIQKSPCINLIPHEWWVANNLLFLFYHHEKNKNNRYNNNKKLVNYLFYFIYL